MVAISAMLQGRLFAGDAHTHTQTLVDGQTCSRIDAELMRLDFKTTRSPVTRQETVGTPLSVASIQQISPGIRSCLVFREHSLQIIEIKHQGLHIGMISGRRPRITLKWQ